MFDELALDVDAVEKHACQGDYNHFLVDFRNLGQRLENPWDNLILDDFKLTILLN